MIKINSILEPTKRLCYFNPDSGEIEKLTNYVDNDDTSKFYIEVLELEVKNLLNGSEKFSDYVVNFNQITKEYELKQKVDTSIASISVHDLIYEIKCNCDDADMQIIQDLKNTCWKFYTSENLKHQVREKNISKNMFLSFSITKKDDPNILYKTLTVDFNKLISQHYYVIPFSEEFEFEGVSISIFTNKRFNSYSYTRITL